MLFSIITVCHNAARTIAPTLRSIQEQTWIDFEYIVKDGASSDGTQQAVIDSGIPGLRFISEPDSGIYDAMNHAMSMAKGEYLIFLNAGDSFASPDTLSHFAEAIRRHDYPGIVYGQTKTVDSERTVIGDRHLRAPEQLSLKSFADGMVVCHQAMAVLRKISDRYDTSYRFSADYLWGIHCLQHSRHNVYLDECVIHYLNEGTTTANRYSSLLERLRIMCRYYGVLPTLLRHVKFAYRSIRRGSIG